MYNESHEVLLKTITKNPVLFAPPAGTRITIMPTPKSPLRKVPFSISKQTKANNTYALIVQRATILELAPFSWPQLQQCINILTSNTSLDHITINFKRMFKALDPYQWPQSKDIKAMLSRLSTLRAISSAKIIWYAELTPDVTFHSGLGVLQETDKAFCRKAVKMSEELMVGKGWKEEEKWLKEEEVAESERTNWQDYCERVDVSPGVFVARSREENLGIGKAEV
jgi:hypothetical protein